MRQPRPSPEHETLSKQQKAQSNSVDMEQERERGQQAEAASRESKVRLSAIVDSAMDAIITVDEKQQILIFNRAAERMFHCRAREAIGQPLERFIPKRFRAAHSSHIESFGRTGVTMRPMATARSVYGLRWNGEKFSIEVSISQLEAEGGKFYTFILRDITERERPEEKLVGFAGIAEQSDDAIIYKSLEGVVTRWNKGAERIYGYTREEIIGRSVSVLIPPECHDELRQILERIGRGERVEHYETTTIGKDGRRIPVSLSISPLKNGTGQIVGASTIGRDLTEFKKAEETIRATSEQLRALSVRFESAKEAEGARISREIHDELGATLSSLRWDLEDVGEAIAESWTGLRLQQMRKKIETMMSLIDTTVNTVRRIASELRPVVLDALGLIEAIEAQAGQFQDRTGIVVQCDGPLAKVDLNREQSAVAFRIFQEALTNVLRHAQATMVKIQMKEEAGEFILQVRDNGRGISAHEKSDPGSLGFIGMSERAQLIGARLEIGGSVGTGAVITVRIPIPGIEWAR